MLGFEVSLAGERLCTAGADDASVLGATVTSVRRAAEDGAHTLDVSLRIGGLAGDAHMDWEVPRKLKVGDTITIRLVDVAIPDPPSRTKRDDKTLVEAEERKYYEHLRAKYHA